MKENQNNGGVIWDSFFSVVKNTNKKPCFWQKALQAKECLLRCQTSL